MFILSVFLLFDTDSVILNTCFCVTILILNRFLGVPLSKFRAFRLLLSFKFHNFAHVIKQTILNTMKKNAIILLSAALLLSSCRTTEQGLLTGAQFGNFIGSAVGGLTGGWHGEMAGALIGTVGGAAAGAAIGTATERSRESRYERMRQQAEYDAPVVDPYAQGDDRIEFDEKPDIGNSRSYSVDELARKTPLEVRKATVADQDGDGVLVRGEECTISFEIVNNTMEPVFDIFPIVEDATGNKHVAISPALRIESIGPLKGIRYTASILADKRLKDGEIVVRVGVAKGKNEIKSQTHELTIPTKKKKETPKGQG